MLALLLPAPCTPVPLACVPGPTVPHARGAGRSVWARVALMLAAVGLLSGCIVRPPRSTQETQVDSQIRGEAVAAGVTGKPFCLHVRYRNHFWPVYSDAQAEAWVTDGACDSKGAARTVSNLRLSWWNDWDDTQTNHQCNHASRCSMDEQRVVVSRNIRCAAAQAADGPYTAFIATDTVPCH